MSIRQSLASVAVEPWRCIMIEAKRLSIYQSVASVTANIAGEPMKHVFVGQRTESDAG